MFAIHYNYKLIAKKVPDSLINLMLNKNTTVSVLLKRKFLNTFFVPLIYITYEQLKRHKVFFVA